MMINRSIGFQPELTRHFGHWLHKAAAAPSNFLAKSRVVRQYKFADSKACPLPATLLRLMRSLAHSLALLIFAATHFAAHGAATQFYGVVLGQRYTQTSSGAPALLTTKGFEAR